MPYDEFDMMAESALYPWLDDDSMADVSLIPPEDYIESAEEADESDCQADYDDSMDGDAASALASAGWGTDEDYGYYGDESDF